MTTSFPHNDTHQHSSWSCPCLNFIIGLFRSITLIFISTSITDDTADEHFAAVDAAPDSKPAVNTDKTSNVTSAINSEQQGTHTSIKRVDLRTYR